MSIPVTFTIEAEEDLDAIEVYLSDRFSYRNAASFVERIRSFCDTLGLAPHRGARRKDTDSEVRTIGFERNVSIVFEVEGDAVVVAGIFYRGRTRPRD